jgi:hypothetical protein
MTIQEIYANPMYVAMASEVDEAGNGPTHREIYEAMHEAGIFDETEEGNSVKFMRSY